MPKEEGSVLLRATLEPKANKETVGDGLSTRANPANGGQTSEDNPQPVSGHADGFIVNIPLGQALENPSKPVPADDGRFLFQRETVIGPDDRVRVQATNVWPFSAHGHMIMRFPNGQVFIGTGTLVDEHHVLTAGHCVFSAADGGFASEIIFNAGQNDSQLPFGSARAVRVLTHPQYEQNEDSNFDMGMLILDRNVGAADQAGFFGLRAVEDSEELHMLRVNVSGYPGDKDDGQEMFTHADVVKSASAERFTYDIDTFGGQSGSGVWTIFDGLGETVVGIHTTGSLSGNGATRITPEKLQLIRSWISQF
jgi:V8-like Glu-specific endopeptidase